jgi:hypothetical protein
MNVGGFFVIGRIETGLVKGTQLVAHSGERVFVTDAGKQFLTDRTYELRTPIADEFSQRSRHALLTRIQVSSGSPQSERPD